MQAEATPVSVFPQTFDQFMAWEPTDGYKYEWYENQLIRFSGLKQKQYFIYSVLNSLFYEKGGHKKGTFMTKPDVMLTPKQMRRPDIAYFTKEQIRQSRLGQDVIPPFVVEVISPTDDAEAVETKITEYFKAGVQVVWQIYPGNQLMYIYTARKQVIICLDDDICSAAPVLPDFAIRVNEVFALPEA